MEKIKELKLNNSDVWTGKTNQDLIVEKINEIIKKVNQIITILDDDYEEDPCNFGDDIDLFICDTNE
jgi:hypothetical protein